MNLPLQNAPVDSFRFGFSNLEGDFSALHPVAKAQKQRNQQQNDKIANVRRMYGSHLAMRLATEAAQFSKPHRLFGLESSTICHDTVLGTDTSIDFSDFLNVPSQRCETSRISLHEVMEIKLGIM